MVRSWVAALLLLLAIAALPERAAAGGTEFPGDGTRSLGRGGAGMARADDAYVMIRNPARLADLWDDQAMIGAHFLFADSCFQPTGSFGIGTVGGPASTFRVGDEVLVLNTAPAGTDANGQPLNTYANEPLPEVCYEGPMPFLPHVALTMKPTHDLGVGLGFFPPDNAALNQWGNRDGTVDTENGLRPNPLRYYRSHLNTSYFSVLAAAGYRINDFIRVGLGFQWQLAVFQARTWTTAVTGLNPINDVRTDVFGRDLFIPGFISSVHLKPFDALDVAIGFKWSDLIKSKAKLDLTSGAFGTGQPANYLLNGVETALTTSVPTTSHNQTGEVRSGPIWVPQLSFGLRYADRLKPLVHDDEWAKAKANSKTTEDSMQNERWDIEVDLVYYFTSKYDYTQFTNTNAQISLITVDGTGFMPPPLVTGVGDCTEYYMTENGGTLCRERRVRTEILGKDQITARIGGDYNVLPGLFTIRAGASYETDGQDPKSLNVQQYMYGRLGMHGGFTVRITEKTDFNFGFAHFIQKDMRLQVNPARIGDYVQLYRQSSTPQAMAMGISPATYHLQTGSGFAIDTMSPEAMATGPFDGVAGVEVPNAGQVEPGPYFINAGSYYYDLSVLSVELVQRF